MSKLRLIQLSDCHVSAAADAFYRGQPALGGLNSIVDACVQWQPDLVVASGDLSEDVSPESYALLAKPFLRLDTDVYLLPGNHDDIALMRSAFSAPSFHILPNHAVGAWHLYFLDTSIEDNPAGRVDHADAERLADAINSQPEPHAFVFMHHQPFLSGSTWIDKYPLKQAERFRRTLSVCKKLRGVGWGHIHHEWELRKDGVAWLGCPSTVCNTLYGAEKFTVDERGPACRWLELSDAGEITTGILYK